MAKKHVNQDKDASFQSAQGRRSGAKPDTSSANRERNIGSGGAEEHSRVAKGNRGGEQKASNR